MTACGDAIVELVAGVTERGVHHAVVLLRHSAREYHPQIHDLDKQLDICLRLAGQDGHKAAVALTLHF